MNRLMTSALLLALALPAQAEEKRELGAHEHGVGNLNIAFEGQQVALELEAPGADIVGFEHHAESNEDRAKIDDAIALLARPLELFVLPAEARCVVSEARVSLEGEEEHEEHGGHGKHEEHEHHDDHAKHDDHAEHDDHAKHGDHAKHSDHDDHHGHAKHEEHAEAEGEHTEFHAEYLLNCAEPEAIDSIEFVYFERFENARELEVQMISDRGTQGFEVERSEPRLDLSGQI